VLTNSFITEANEHYGAKEAELGPEILRDVERNILLFIIDQRWREHLQEMDYLQEGINLRAMGQKDPLVEWQREGYDMFGHLVRAIDDDFVRYAMHAEVTVEVAPAQIQNLQLSSADESNIGGFGLDVGEMFAATAEPPQAVVSVGNDGVQRVEEQELNLQPIVKSEQEKTGRNEPCYCGSGKKFKACHGKNS
jgi:preprotein translocase subunit SecA